MRTRQPRTVCQTPEAPVCPHLLSPLPGHLCSCITFTHDGLLQRLSHARACLDFQRGQDCAREHPLEHARCIGCWELVRLPGKAPPQASSIFIQITGLLQPAATCFGSDCSGLWPDEDEDEEDEDAGDDDLCPKGPFGGCWGVGTPSLQIMHELAVVWRDKLACWRPSGMAPGHCSSCLARHADVPDSWASVQD